MFELRPYRRQHPAVYNPFHDMEEWERRFFDNPFGPLTEREGPALFSADLTDEGDHYLLEADLPGFDKKDLHLTVGDNTLTVEAERHSEHEKKEKKDKYLCVERSYGRVCRRFDLDGVDPDGIRARYENGVLQVTLPKKEAAPPARRELPID